MSPHPLCASRQHPRLIYRRSPPAESRSCVQAAIEKMPLSVQDFMVAAKSKAAYCSRFNPRARAFEFAATRPRKAMMKKRSLQRFGDARFNLSSRGNRHIGR